MATQMSTYQGREFEVEKTNDTRVPYHLKGKRGAFYGLVRNVNHPEMLYVINGRYFRVLEGWFTDKNGLIEPC